MLDPDRPWRVFVSHSRDLDGRVSVSSELKSYVDGAREAIRDGDHVPITMRDFAPATWPSAETCRMAVRRSDVFVLILGSRYGSFLRDGSGISYTELEYDLAVELGLPVLAFFLDEIDNGSDAHHDIDVKAREARDRFHRRVHDDAGTVVSVPSHHDLYRKLNRALQDLASMAQAERRRVDDERRTRERVEQDRRVAQRLERDQEWRRRRHTEAVEIRRDRRVRWAAVATLTAVAAGAAGAILWATSTSSGTGSASASPPPASTSDQARAEPAPADAPVDPAAALDRRVESDAARAEAVLDRWVPQLSTLSAAYDVPGRPGTRQTPDFILAETERLTRAYPEAIVVDPRDFSSYTVGPVEPHWVVLSATHFPGPAQVKAWCTENDRQFPTDCLAKQLSHVKSSKVATDTGGQ